jgi:hypothetical protein
MGAAFGREPCVAQGDRRDYRLTGHPPSRVFHFAQSDFAKGKAEGKAEGKATELAASLKQLT